MKAGARASSDRSGLARQRALITGASSGIGKAIALALAGCGVRLMLAGRDRGRLTDTRKKCLELTDVALAAYCDMGETQAVERLAKRVGARLGGLEILVHAAGMMLLRGSRSSSVADFQAQFAVNVLGPYLLTKQLLPLLEGGGGQVVFVNSSVIYFPRPETTQYAATKHALKGLADGLRAEVNDKGVRVLSVFPGRTATALQERLFRAEGKDYRPERLLQPEDLALMVVQALRLPRSAEVTEIHMRPMCKG